MKHAVSFFHFFFFSFSLDFFSFSFLSFFLSAEGDFTSALGLVADWLLVSDGCAVVFAVGVGEVGGGVAVGAVVATAGLLSAATACLTGAGVGVAACLGVLGLTGDNCGCVVASRGEVLPLTSPEPVFAAPTWFSFGKLSVPGLVVLASLGG